jgi:tetratricopeptide (TPR) repeat protein
MTKRNLVWMSAALALALTVSAPPAMAGEKKEIRYAVSLAKKGLWREAAFRFRGLLDKHPDDPRLWNNLAVAYEASGEFKLAHEAYEKALELEPDRLDEMMMNREAFESFYVQWKIRRDILDDEPIMDESDSASPDAVPEPPEEEKEPPAGTLIPHEETPAPPEPGGGG